MALWVARCYHTHYLAAVPGRGRLGGGGGVFGGCCAAPNAKTFLGASLTLFVFDALQGIRFPTNKVENLRTKGGITVNSGR